MGRGRLLKKIPEIKLNITAAKTASIFHQKIKISERNAQIGETVWNTREYINITRDINKMKMVCRKLSFYSIE